jgi:hypothetical protein
VVVRPLGRLMRALRHGGSLAQRSCS